MASPQRERARRFLVEQGLSVHGGLLASLTALILEAEGRGLASAVCGICQFDKVLQDGFVAPLDGFAQLGEHVADRDRTAAPCIWCVGGFIVETGVMCRACHGASYSAPGEGG